MTAYKELKLILGDEWCVDGVTPEGETVLLEYGDSYLDEDGNTVTTIKETVFQKNGWTRIHIYHPDETIEELFEK